MLDRVGQALITAYKRENDGMTDNIYVIPNRAESTIRMFVRKTVVDDVYEPYEELSVEEAREYKPGAMLGDIIDIDVPTRYFSRIAAQTAKQVIIQGIREAERGMVLSEFESKEHEILTAQVSRIDPRSGSIILEMVSQGEKTEAVLTTSEQVPGERYEEGDHVKVYVIEVRKGTRGARVGSIVEELGGEKIDIIKWSEDTAAFVSAALAPADVISASLQPDGKSCRVIVPDDQLSLAIGKEGQNARLAAKLTGCKIDIAPASQAHTLPDLSPLNALLNNSHEEDGAAESDGVSEPDSIPVPEPGGVSEPDSIPTPEPGDVSEPDSIPTPEPDDVPEPETLPSPEPEPTPDHRLVLDIEAIAREVLESSPTAEPTAG